MDTIDPPQQPQRFTVRNLLRVSFLAFLNILILAFFAAYFSNQRLDLIDTIGVVGDSVGVVTGLLGIWFFFQSEQLNRTTAVNLERTTATVDDLRNQMWKMIQETFASLTTRDDGKDVELALGIVREYAKKEGNSIPDELKQALQVIESRVESLERQKDAISAATSAASTPFAVHLLRYSGAERRAIEALVSAYHQRKFPLPRQALVDILADELPMMGPARLSNTFLALAGQGFIELMGHDASGAPIYRPGPRLLTVAQLYEPGQRVSDGFDEEVSSA